MEFLPYALIVGGIVAASLLGAWALGRRRVTRTTTDDPLQRSELDLESEDQKAREQFEELLRDNPRFGGFG